jgi:16S rRNA (guanine(966)-N(2))-methyltransferase RsmD
MSPRGDAAAEPSAGTKHTSGPKRGAGPETGIRTKTGTRTKTWTPAEVSSTKASTDAKAATRHAANQIRIIGGDWKRTPLPVVDAEGLRPTPDRVRETLFNWLGQRLDGLSCLDLFAGSGALGFEAASRGAARVLMIERNPRAAAQLRSNQAKLAQSGNADAIEIVEADALRVATGLPRGAFDVVFVDPPFGAALTGGALAAALPLLRKEGLLYVEAGEPLDAVFEAQASTATATATATDRTPGWPNLAGWRILRQGRAGVVHYHLLQRENEE